jgi:hypothetical protein
VLDYRRSFGSLPWLDVLVVMLKPLIATSLDELSRKTLWIHPQLMVLPRGRKTCMVLPRDIQVSRVLVAFSETVQEHGSVSIPAKWLSLRAYKQGFGLASYVG